MMGDPFEFPDPESADDALGVVVETESITADMVLAAYRRGIFPWSEHPVRWYSPDPRAVFFRERIFLPSNLPKLTRKAKFRVTYDNAFHDVIRACADAHRDEGEWITDGFVNAYGELHARGYAHSVEVWQEDSLVGGMYGVQLRGLFSGESMFHRVDNASKVAFAALVQKLDAVGNVLFDAQVINRHTARLGAVLLRRTDYLWLLEHALETPERVGKW